MTNSQHLATGLVEELATLFREEDGIFRSDDSGYWSNLDITENAALVKSLQSNPAEQALRSTYPQLYDIVYSPKRSAGLELLELEGHETCIDYGCMWGALTIPLAKRTGFVLGVDQTIESLQFLRARTTESGCRNVALLNHDIRKMPILTNKADVAIVNGVLEWVPEQGSVQLKQFFGRRGTRAYTGIPSDHQVQFLDRVMKNLRRGGKLYLAIENRYDLKGFFGAPDPHSNLLFTACLVRPIANMISRIWIGRPYVNWIYSFAELKKMLSRVGFKQVDLYMCFPDYRYPERIIPYDGDLTQFTATIPAYNSKGQFSAKRAMARVVEQFAFRQLGLRWFAPSIIVIAIA